MPLLTDKIVVFDGNKDAFETVMSVTSQHDAPVRVIVVAPKGAGKTSMMLARARDKDLLSTSQILGCNAHEIINALNIGVNDEFLNEVGTTDILLIDDFDFLLESDMGKQVAKLLLAERNSRKLDTILFVHEMLSTDEKDSIGGVVDNYAVIEMQPLTAAGRIELARKNEQAASAGSEDAAVLSDEALDYVANTFVDDLKDLELAIRFLVTGAGYDPGYIITAADAQERLNA